MKTLKNTIQYRGRLQKNSWRTRSRLVAACRVELWALGVAAFLSLAAATFTWAQAGPSIEYQVKAAFLLNFAKFVDWPPDAFSSDKSPIQFCVFKYDPFGNALDEILQGKTINNHGLIARRIKELSDLKSCQLVFISGSEDRRLPEILNFLKGTSVLVVGESDDFAERGGGIQFFLETNKLRFAVNVDAVQQARLGVSSKLLAMAKIVRDPGHPKGN